MVGYDFTCYCKEDCVSNNGMKFYSGELYQVDGNFSGEFYYDVYDNTGRFLSYCSYDFLGDYFNVVPDVLGEVDKLFNKVMDDRLY